MMRWPVVERQMRDALVGCHMRGPGGVFMPNRQTSKEDTMTLRVPKAELPAELRENMIKQLGAVPNPSR